jgi:hypothetical protein
LLKINMKTFWFEILDNKYGLQGWTTRMNSQLGQPLHMLYDSNMIDRNYNLGFILST